MAFIEKEGSYKAKVVGKDYCKSKGGAEQLAVRFEVVDGVEAGHQIMEFLSFSDAALKYTVEKMRAMGWAGLDLADLSTLGTNEVEIVVRPEEWDGQVKMRVKFINSLGGVALKTALNEGERKSFAARMRGMIAGLDPAGAKATPAKPKSREEPPPPDDSEIPF